MNDVPVDQDAKDPLLPVSTPEHKPHDAEIATYCLYEVEENETFEAEQLNCATASFHQHLHPLVESNDCHSSQDDSEKTDKLYPKMTKFGLERGQAVRSGGLSCFQDNGRDDFSDWVLEDKDPTELWPEHLKEDESASEIR